MITDEPSLCCDASTTEGDEYAIDVIIVQCSTNSSSTSMRQPITRQRDSIGMRFVRGARSARFGAAGLGPAYVSMSVLAATAAHTHTHGVSVRIRRTITPEKYEAITA